MQHLQTPAAGDHTLSAHLPIAITPGDIAGIGPEIVIKAFRDAPDVMQGCFVVGDVALMRRAAQWLGNVTGQGLALPVACLGLGLPTPRFGFCTIWLRPICHALKKSRSTLLLLPSLPDFP